MVKNGQNYGNYSFTLAQSKLLKIPTLSQAEHMPLSEISTRVCVMRSQPRSHDSQPFTLLFRFPVFATLRK